MLSLQLYNDFAMRSARDIDLLIRWKDIDRASEILKANGYNLFPAKKKSSSLNKRLYRHTLYDFMFVNQEIHITMELHWSLAFHNYFKKSNDLGLEAMIDYIIYNNHPIPILNKQMQLLFLAVHGSKHKWSLLYWLKDFSDYLIQYSNPDEAMELSRRFKVEHSMLQGMYLSQMFSLYPGTLKNYPESDYVKKYLIPPALKEMELQPSRSAIYDIKNVFYFMKLRPGILYKTYCLIHMFYRFFIRAILRFF